MSYDVLHHSGEVCDRARFQRLTSLLQWVNENDNFYKHAYRKVDIKAINTLSDLQLIPKINKEDLNKLQENLPPFGGLGNNDTLSPEYLFISPGPICEPGFLNDNYWRMSRALASANFYSNDIVHNTFSYHLTPGAWMVDVGARSIGCTVIPAGTAPLDMQMQVIKHYQPTAYCGTPDFLMRLVQSYQEKYGEVISIQKALVSGGALTPNLIEYFNEIKIAVKQCYATAELGVVAYEVDDHDGLLIDRDIVLEIVCPETGQNVDGDKKGEVVVTTLRNNYPLIRFCTGDISSYLSVEDSERRNRYIKGILGRVDDATKVKGMFIRPNQIKTFLAECPNIMKARLLIHRINENDQAILHCELNDKTISYDTQSIKTEILNRFRSICYVGCEISIVPNGTIPNDGKVIVDLREY